jgi:hypothetical protein
VQTSIFSNILNFSFVIFLFLYGGGVKIRSARSGRMIPRYWPGWIAQSCRPAPRLVEERNLRAMFGFLRKGKQETGMDSARFFCILGSVDLVSFFIVPHSIPKSLSCGC